MINWSLEDKGGVFTFKQNFWEGSRFPGILPSPTSVPDTHTHTHTLSDSGAVQPDIALSVGLELGIVPILGSPGCKHRISPAVALCVCSSEDPRHLIWSSRGPGSDGRLVVAGDVL